MKVKAGGKWSEGSLKARLANLGWIVPQSTLLKQNGEWRVVDGIELLSLTQISDVIADTSGWVYDTVRGWYRDVYPTVQNNYPPMVSKFSVDTLSKIRRVRATFTGYYNNPVEGLHLNYIRIHLSNGTTQTIGTNDAWAHGPSGQRIYKGDAGFEEKVTRNVLGERYTYTVPEGVYVTGLDVLSYPAYTENRYYPSSLRGMRDFEFTLRH